MRHRAFAGEPGHGKVLQLAAVDRVGEVEQPCGRRSPPSPRPSRPARASRRNIEVASAPPSGGWPRPSFRWQLWQARALNSGPSPSEAWVEDGDETQILLNSALPSLNVPSFLEGDVGGGVREGVPVGALARRAGAALHQPRTAPAWRSRSAGRVTATDAREILRGQIVARSSPGRTGQRVCRRQGRRPPARDRAAKRCEEQCGAGVCRRGVPCRLRRRAAHRFEGAPHPSCPSPPRWRLRR